MRHRFLMAAGGLLALTAGCSLVRSGPPGPSSSGALRRFGGQVTMQGSALSAILEVRGPDRHVQAALRIPALDLSAQGSGRISDGHVDLSLSYSSSCPGTARIQGDLERGGERIRGTISAKDCTGRETGNVVFVLRRPDAVTPDTTVLSGFRIEMRSPPQ